MHFPNSTSRSRRAGDGRWLPLLFGAVISCLAIIYYDFIFGDRLFLFQDIGSDTIAQFWPHFAEINRSFHEGHLLTWTFRQGLGQNLLGYYWDPLNIILYLVPVKVIPQAIIWVELLKSVLSSWFAFSLVRKFDCHVGVALFASVSFVCSSYFLIAGTWYLPSTEALYTVAIIYGLEALIREGNPLFVSPAVALLAVAQPFCVFHVSILSAAYLWLRSILTQQREGLGVKKIYFAACRLFLLGLGLSSALSLEGIALMAQSPRGAGGASLSSSLLATSATVFADWARAYTAAFRSLGHDLLGNGSHFSGQGSYLEAPAYFTGMLTILLVPQLLVRGTRRMRVFGVLIICLIVSPVAVPLLRISFWLFTGDYYRTISLYSIFGILALSVWSFQSVVIPKSVSQLTLWCTVSIVLVALYFPVNPAGLTINKECRWLATVFVLLHAFLLCGVQLGRTPSSFLIIAAALELTVLGYLAVDARVALAKPTLMQKSGYNDFTVEALDFVKKRDAGFFRIDKYYYSSPSHFKGLNDAKIQDYFSTSSYLSFNQSNYIAFLGGVGVIEPKNEGATRLARGLVSRPALETLASVRYIFTKQQLASLEEARYHKIADFGDVSVYENGYFLPLGIAFSQAITEERFMKMAQEEKELVLLEAVVLKKDRKELPEYRNSPIPSVSWDRYEKAAKKLSQDAFRMRSFTCTQINGTIDLDKSQMLMFSIPFDPGWSAQVDGFSYPLRVVDFGLMGLLIGPGTHRVQLAFRPVFESVGVWITGVSCVLYAILAWGRRRKPRPV